MLAGLAAALGAAALFGVASVLQALAARRLPPARGLSAELVLALARDPALLAALALNLAGFALHLAALRLLPLFLAQAAISASLAVTAVLGVRLVGDRLSPRDCAAVAGVCTGLLLLAASAGPAGQERGGATFRLGLVLAVAALAAAGVAAGRHHGTHAAAMLGLVAGLGFALVSIAGRVLPEPGLLAWGQDVAAYVLLASGALAFVLYALALQRGSVTTATAPLVITQTVAPSAVGVLALDDAVRPGWLPWATLGLALAAAGAVALARFESVPPVSR